MRLNLVMCFRRIPMPRGNIWSGKQKFIMEVTPLDKAILRSKLQVEERNLFLLRHPYLTEEEESLFQKANPPRDPKLVAFEARRARAPKPNVSIEERLNHLRVTEAWE